MRSLVNAYKAIYQTLSYRQSHMRACGCAGWKIFSRSFIERWRSCCGHTYSVKHHTMQ